jgi:hypothetical protein
MIKAYAVTDDVNHVAVFTMLVDAEFAASQWRRADPNVLVRIVTLVEQEYLLKAVDKLRFCEQELKRWGERCDAIEECLVGKVP